jgi:UDP-N-acetylmuramate dehydrogenase
MSDPMPADAQSEARTMTIQENVPLAPLTTLGVGGPARYLAEASTEDEVREAIAFARGKGAPLFVLGGGSNLLVSDGGWPGLVLKVAIGEVRRSGTGRAASFDVGAGMDWDKFVAHAVSENCAGVECLSGVPGSVGGTPVQNVGAYGQDVSETIESVRALDLKEDRVVTLPEEMCGFRYRASIFNTTERGRYIILRVMFRLTEGAVPALRYADLQKHFAAVAEPPSLLQVRDAVRQIRQSKGMLIVPGDPDSRSAGSFFKNPVLSAAQFRALADRARSKGLKVPSYPALDAQRKVSAAWLVEHSGFKKGFKFGAAGISSKHALALINAGGARAEEIMRLKDAIQRGVQLMWDIVLEPEPVLVGF